MKRKDFELLAQLRQVMDRRGWTQVALAGSIGVTQGHLSKILSMKVAISRSVRIKIATLVVEGEQNHSPIEIRTIEALRSSTSFRSLVLAALEMHEKA